MKAFRLGLGILGLALGHSAFAQSWTITKANNLLHASYGTPNASPELFVIDLNSSYYRLNTGPGCGWGTSVVLWPCYWSKNVLYQGGPVSTVTWSTSGSTLTLKLLGRIGALSCTGTIVLNPPVGKTLTASVTQGVTGTVTLDNRPNEAYKPVFLSSMCISPTSWDSYNLLTDLGLHWYPKMGMVNAAEKSKTIQVTGGNSSWKINGPTITVKMPSAFPVTGWVTSSSNPNDDNIGIWAAATAVQKTFTYTVVATSN